MGSSRRQRPKRLAPKLFAIRKHLRLTQPQMAEKLENPHVKSGHVSAYELGKREPNLIVLLKYARLAQVPMEMLVDDKMSLPEDMQDKYFSARILTKHTLK